MPLTDKGKEIMANLVKEHGPEKGESVFYAMKNKGELTGVDSGELMRFYATEQISENISETPEGFLLCTNVPITRVGEFIYRSGEVPVTADQSGTIRIRRDALDVFNEIAIKSFEGKPVTINHPTDFVGPENWQELAHGTVQNVRPGEGQNHDLLVADLLITTEKAIKLVKAGLREISCGYDAQYEEIEEGLGKQHQIIGNHVALVNKGRAGKRCAIGDKTCDSCGACNCNKDKNTMKEEDSMTFKQQVRKWLDSCPAKDDEETEEEKAARLAKEEKETSDKKAQDKGFKDADEEAEFEEFKKKKADDKKAKDADEETEEEKEARLAKEKEAEEAKDKKSKDAEGDSIEALAQRVTQLEGLIKALMAEEEGEETDDKKAKDADEEEEKEKKEDEETKATADCEAQWPEVAHRAEILFAGMSLKKPTKDHARFIRAIKIGALKGAALRVETKDAVNAFARGRAFDSMPDEALDAVFMGASELVRNTNNSKVQTRDVKIGPTQDNSASGMARSINVRNKEVYRKQDA